MSTERIHTRLRRRKANQEEERGDEGQGGRAHFQIANQRGTRRYGCDGMHSLTHTDNSITHTQRQYKRPHTYSHDSHSLILTHTLSHDSHSLILTHTKRKHEPRYFCLACRSAVPYTIICQGDKKGHKQQAYAWLTGVRKKATQKHMMYGCPSLVYQG